MTSSVKARHRKAAPPLTPLSDAGPVARRGLAVAASSGLALTIIASGANAAGEGTDVGESAGASLWWNGDSAAAGCSPSASSQSPSPDPVPSPTPEGSASPGAEATASPTPVDPNVAGAGTYRLSVQLGGETVTGEQVFVIE